MPVRYYYAPFSFLRFICLLTLAGALLVPGAARAQLPDAAADAPFSRVRVWLGPQGLRELAHLGIAADHGQSKSGVWFESDFSAYEIRRLRAAGRRCEVLIADVGAHYRQQNQPAAASIPDRTQSGLTCAPVPTYPAVSSFQLGSMGGFFTYDELLQQLDSMQQRWPNLISVRQPLGPTRTHEGREVWWVKISDNPAANEPEPEMLYTGVHHAREPMSAAQLVYYMYYLLENYATSPDVRAIVDNTELYFVPCLNPDGYIRNETTDPTGGGMWRKNRSSNADGSIGVDLNRNYGNHWGFDDFGSSPLGFSEVYRGTAGFSEPETQLIRDFSLQHEFRLALNYHAFGNLLIYPYGYEANLYSPDSAQFTDYGRWLTRADRYAFGTGNQTVGYVTNGDSDDWQYSTVQGPKPKTFSFTPEVGKASEGFWPPAVRILPLCIENLTRNLDAARLLLADAVIADASPRFCRQRATYARYSLTQLGLQTPGTYTVTLTPLAGAGTAGPPKTYTLAAVREQRIDSIGLTLAPAVLSGQAFRYVLSVDNGLFTRRDTLTKVLGAPTLAFASDGNSLAGWDSPTGWDVDITTAHSGPASLGDSPGTNYPDLLENTLTTAQPVDLRGASHAELTFWARWAIETRFDFGQVLASADNGATWQPLCGRYTRPGSGFQPLDEPIYDGFQLAWVREAISLDDFAGQEILVRFQLTSDDFTNEDGLNIDDVRIEKIGSRVGVAQPVPPAVLLSVYPNPASHTVTLAPANLPAAGGHLVVRDALGRRVWQGAVAAAQPHTLDVRAWAGGLYLATVEAADYRHATVRFAVTPAATTP